MCTLVYIEKEIKSKGVTKCTHNYPNMTENLSK